MAKLAGNAARVWLDHYDLSGYLTAGNLTVNQPAIDVECLSDTGPRVVVGNYSGNISLTGLGDFADNLVDEIIHGVIDTDDHYVMVSPNGVSGEGAIAYDWLVRNTSQPRSFSVGNAVALNSEWAGAGGLSRGVILGNATVTGAGNRTGQNLGTTTSGQVLRAVFRVLTFSGTNITLTVQESQNDGSPDTYAAISGMTSGALTAAGTVVTTTTAATETWKRVNIAGTFSSALIAVTLGVVQPTAT